MGSRTGGVELRPFTDREVNRDLAAVYARVAVAQPRLPDGRQLHLYDGWGTSSHFRCLQATTGLRPYRYVQYIRNSYDAPV